MRWKWGSLCQERPQLVDVAKQVGFFLNNGKTGDVFNISMPTRFGKSLLATSLSVYLLLRNPKTRILRASYSADLAELFSIQVREQYISFFEKNKMALPVIDGTRGRWSIDGYSELNHVGVGINGTITGFGFDIAIIDDTVKNMSEAMSAAYRRQLEVFKSSVLLGRLENERKIINVGTRWAVNDWFSYWPGAQSFILPAIVDGRSACEAWKTTKELELERERVSEDVWMAQYMQQPTAEGQVMLFEGYRPETVEEVAKEGAQSVLVIDPATEYGRDYFVVGDYCLKAGFIYLLDMFAQQRASLEEVVNWIKGRKYGVCYIECNGGGAEIARRLQSMGVGGIVGFTTSRDKYFRASLIKDKIINYFRINENINKEVQQEMVRQFALFPTGEHDDLLDNIVMAFERLQA